ncbi:discoidin domain-containing protein [Crossiella sp. SN42]|uniref:discoidin domain-containing protein n=1 Tax=Crossiella sp. SN42 TaxID=2944808 RepID=UPI00207C3BF1|nr:discoidin domain-containing protein [Crossiella sp. SN42]MCO1582542.1 discoidin domain-containing protein [Crossiella sp. SN42]
MRVPRPLRRLIGVLSLLALLALGQQAQAQPAERTLGAITGISQDGATVTISAGSDRVRVGFLQPDVFRLWLGPGGSFADPAGRAILTSTDFGPVRTTVTETTDYYKIETDAVVLRAYQKPLRFALYRKDNQTLVWQESTGLTWSSSAARQRLVRGQDEQFYGTGLRLGAWALRDKTVPVRVDNKWNEGNNASPAPFYLSTNGYGVVRNTWSPGSYSFTSPVQTTHEEGRFDAVYFAGQGLKEVLDRYTDVTGKPFLAPIYGLEMGHADCWNASNPEYQGDHNRVDHQKTPDVLKYAEQARAADMPSGWFLPNDGYGCGYTKLPETVKSLQEKGFYTGLWTSTGLKNVKEEVGAGSRMIKTDVAWIGGGYQKAFEGVQQAVSGIEDNSDARRFVWTVDGWAGTQRNAVVWTGDTEGDWDNMRWHVPAITGAGFSALNYAAGDVDGIFAGSPDTYSRDLQWKAFTPVLMSMSGWGAKNPTSAYQDKQPWRFDAAHQEINRKYLKLKMRLTPYFYSMARVAHETGVPTTRAMVLEYPNDPVARGNQTSQQFLAGDAFLVAPVTSATATRDGIYLPAGTWTDYWTGTVYQGPGTFDGYQAPLDRLPLFVKGGAIVPMWPQLSHHREKPKTPITFDVYPNGSSSFELYEDDGVTRRFQRGEFAKQQVSVSAPTGGRGDVTVRVGASVGDYAGKPAGRGYELAVHVAGAPGKVTLGGSALTGYAKRADYEAAATGWFFERGVLHVRTGAQSTGAAFTVTAEGVQLPVPQAIPTRADEPIAKSGWTVKHVDSQETAGENGAAANAIDDNPGTQWHTQWSGTGSALPHEIQLDLGATHEITGLSYLPRQDAGVNGGIKGYEVYVSADGTSWGQAVATGTFAADKGEKLVSFAAKTGRYLRLRATSEINGGTWTSAAEIGARRLKK